MGNERNLFSFLVNANGELKNIDNPPTIDEDNILLVIDEDKECNWLYIGLNTTLIHRRAAVRAVNSIKRFGYPFKNKLIGNRCKELVIIDADDEPEIRASKIQRLKSSLALHCAKPVFKNTGTAQVKPPVFKNGCLIRPIEELNAKIKSASQRFSRNEILTNSSDAPSEDGYMKLGVLLTSILSTYPEIKITRRGEQYAINSPENPLCDVKIKKDRLIVSKSSTFGGEEKKYNIQKKFINLMRESSKIFKEES